MEFEEYLKSTEKNKRILIYEPGGWEAITNKSGTFGKILERRGASPILSFCDGVISNACIQRADDESQNIENWNKKCAKCASKILKSVNRNLNIPSISTSELINSTDLQDINKFVADAKSTNLYPTQFFKGIDVGSFAANSLKRHLKNKLSIDPANLLKNQEDRELFYSYLRTAVTNTIYCLKLLPHFDKLITSHGNGWVDYGPCLSVAKKLGVKVYFWNSGFEPGSHYLSDSTGNRLGPFKLKPSKVHVEIAAGRVKKFLHSRYLTQNSIDRTKETVSDENIKDYIAGLDPSINPKKIERREEIYAVSKKKIADICEIDANKPLVVIFEHLLWDSWIGSTSLNFKSIEQWTTDLLNIATKNLDFNFILKSHPRDHIIRGAGDKIRSKNIFAWNDVKDKSTKSQSICDLDLLFAFDLGVTMHGTIGIEFPTLGKNIITCEESFYSDCGFTQYVKNFEELNLAINTLAKKKLSENNRQSAIRYAYAYFFEKPIFLKWQKKDHHKNFNHKNIAHLWAIRKTFNNDFNSELLTPDMF